MVVVNVLIFFTILGLLEFRHRRVLRGEDQFTPVQATMTLAEFDHAVAKGRKLVILDEYVLDVAEFTDFHIGGKFVLQNTIGTDISKFFYGGYSMTGNLESPPAQGY